MESIFLISAGLLLAGLLGYPLALMAWNGAREALAGVRFVAGGADRRARRRDDRWPTVTIVLSAFDEAGCIRQKIENCLALDYPADRFEVLVGCDGCTDGTVEAARQVSDERVTVLDLSPRSGKSSVLSRLVPAAHGDVVVLTDANVHVQPAALKALVRHFQDPAVGAAVGRLRLFNRIRRDYEESLYWKYETVLKYEEGKNGCVLGANGGLYAIRRILFAPLPPETIVDDFVIPARIAARGWKVPYEPLAEAYEETTEDYGREFGRRARIGAGNWQSIRLVPGLLDPRSGFLFVAFVGHKLLRWTAPLWMALALASNAVLAGRDPAWLVPLLGQLGFYAAAWVGRRRPGGRTSRVASAAWYYVAMNAALAVGFWRFLRGTQRAAWDRTERLPPAGARAA